MFSKKAEIPAQIFIYISAIILFSFILVYGYNAINEFKEKSEEIAYIKFKTEIISAIKRVSPDYGTLKREEFFIGGKYTKVCFVQNYNRPIDIKIADPIINNSVQNDVTKNAFLFTQTFQESFDAGKINVTNGEGYLCINLQNGKAKIQLEGKGDHADISEW